MKAPPPAPVTADDARAGRARVLAAKAARKAVAFQPVETILINPAFAARVPSTRLQASRIATAADDRHPDSQTAEIQIRVALINRFNALGTAEIVRLA